MTESDALIGHGLTFPFRISARGGLALARGDQELTEAIRIILGTALGQRVMRPEFGCRIHELLFAPIDTSTAGMAIHYVKEALGRWEPRIDVLEVDVEMGSDDGRVDILIRYRVRSTHDERALVYPFYTIPGEE
jgi:phage baseplate assembly protein W